MEMDGPDEIRQVCPLDRDRLLVFGPVAGGDGYIVWILSQIDGSDSAIKFFSQPKHLIPLLF